MIPVTLVAELANFNDKVRLPGTAFLATTPNPSGRQWDSNDFWRRALQDLIDAYNEICAYCSSWTHRQDSSIDHFVPRSVAPARAYEWDNFRLSRQRLNNRKGNYQDVIDPFNLAPGWFKLDFPTFRLVPNPNLPAEDRGRVVATIDRLQFNNDNDYVNERVGAIRQYCLGKATFAQLVHLYPFIAAEMRAQDFDTNFLAGMRAFFATNP